MTQKKERKTPPNKIEEPKNLTKRFTIPAHKKRVFDHLDKVAKKGNMSAYIVDLVESDLDGNNNADMSEVINQLSILSDKIDRLSASGVNVESNTQEPEEPVTSDNLSDLWNDLT